MSTPVILLLALILEAAVGTPKWLAGWIPRPAALMCRAVAALGGVLNTGRFGVLAGGLAGALAGALTLAVLMGGAYLLGWGLSLLGGAVQVLITASLLAQRSIVLQLRAVTDGLRTAVPGGRAPVAQPVHPGAAATDQPATARATITRAATAFSDSVVAPAFWFLVGGLPALLLYGIVRTARSRIAPHPSGTAPFDKATVLMEDALNLIPARLAALLITLPAGVAGRTLDIAREAGRHQRPNEAWPQAALARAVGVALDGPSVYNGQVQEHPWVNEAGAQNIGPAQIEDATRRLWQAWALMLALIAALALLGT